MFMIVPYNDKNNYDNGHKHSHITSLIDLGEVRLPSLIKIHKS